MLTTTMQLIYSHCIDLVVFYVDLCSCNYHVDESS